MSGQAEPVHGGRRQDSGGGSLRKQVVSWCLFDFANSSFTTVVVTSVFAVYFVGTVVPRGRLSGELLWSVATSISLLISAALSPLLGALADSRAWKRGFLIGSSLACIGSTALLATVRPGDVHRGMILFIVANVGFEIGYVFYNGFLPEISPPERAGRISGLGWAVGYLGGMLSLLLALVPVRLLQPDHATAEQLEHGVRLSFLLVAAHFLLFALPAFTFLRDHRPAEAPPPFDPLEPFRRIGASFRQIGRYPETWKFLLANLVYNDGVVTIFFFAGIYMDRALHFSQTGIILVILLINVPSAAGSFLFGLLSDRIGGKTTILITLAILVSAVLAMAFLSPGEGATEAQLQRARIVFCVLAMIAGLGIGANQSASRGLMSRLIPEKRHAEFFGFFIFSGKLSSVLAPLTYGLVAQTTGSQALAILSVVIFLAAGGMILLTVDEPKYDA